ncbi:beta-glucosidase [Cellulomonas hominis]|uniref:beta-glucosidase n=1 Tax=Cellulomonas hominis TaxID=156981 RepID=A0A511FGN9_9CELL|nr:glycoside hydrolase family 3 N-terminal domain-containing protein [Cellulomonas hominis]MBB5471373.1 beta-glucosidase [Cellulomonas hominis]NKY07094.1 glycoside hydrolase family 3 protein [Cellulomonas hominis]GEL48425.1 beta-glucosidase [Cellulomonas hominis]
MTTARTRRGTTTAAVLTGTALLAVAACTGGTPEDAFTTREVTDGRTTFVVVTNPGDAPVLSYGAGSGVELLSERVGGRTVAFKDMNANGTLDTWEDWRESPADRAAALAGELATEQLAGLMLYGTQEHSPADGLTAHQEQYLAESHVRSVLNAGPNDVDANVTWSNEVQAFVESLATADRPYVPVNFTSDPRSTAGAAGYNSPGDDLSRWPSNLGLAATRDVGTVHEFATTISAEYRALGIATAMSPQIDLATDPRWLRTEGTFGEDAELTAAFAAANVDGFQSSPGVDGWGPESINAMIKHWAGEGPGEGGREPHTDAGKYAVYPGGNFATHTQAFLGALDSASVMTSYSIVVGPDGEPLFADRTGAAYDTGRIAQLRAEYDGVVITDWNVTRSISDAGSTGGTGWGVEDLTEDERHDAVLRTGHDMVGGNNDVAPVLAAYDLWQADYDAGRVGVDADTRFRESAARILRMMFQPGLYENPYLDLDESRAIAGSADKVAAGYEAQLDSVVMLKNSDGTVAPADADAWRGATVYVPRTSTLDLGGKLGGVVPPEGPGLDVAALEQHVGAVVTDEAVLDADGRVVGYTAPDLTDVDLVLVGMRSPVNGTHFSPVGHDDATGEWYPLSLQYRPYTADGEHVRRVSISGDVLPDGTRENRSYYGATSRIANEADLDAFERAVAAVGASGRDIPVVTVLKATNPTVPAEFEAASDAVLVGFGVSDAALVEVALGLHEPQGRLPMAFPASMDAFEAQLEDVGGDTEPYVDAAGNAYGIGFGLGYGGVVTG